MSQRFLDRDLKRVIPLIEKGVSKEEILAEHRPYCWGLQCIDGNYGR